MKQQTTAVKVYTAESWWTAKQRDGFTQLARAEFDKRKAAGEKQPVGRVNIPEKWSR